MFVRSGADNGVPFCRQNSLKEPVIRGSGFVDIIEQDNVRRGFECFPKRSPKGMLDVFSHSSESFSAIVRRSV